MRRFPYFSMIVFILVSFGCALPGRSAAVTSTPAPTTTNTLEPTATSIPTETSTPTPLPSATPDVTATAAARATEAASNTLAELDKLLGDTDIPYKDGHLAWQQSEPLDIHMKGPDVRSLEIGDGLKAGNFILKSDVTWEATGILICGAIFRSEPNLEDGKQYQFVYLRLSGLPAWAIEVHEFGNYRSTPTGSKTSGALDLRNGATNQFLLVVQDDSFTVYLNGVRQGKYFDYSNQRTDGYFGFYGWQDSGDGNCDFKNSWIWSLDS